MSCASCGSPNPPDNQFCGLLRRNLWAPVFTTLSESRDAEVRELLSRYFDTCRRLIGRYGGAVEKFIGDAVMAVWGTPTATEDDAERAVRAGLDLVAAVSALGKEVGADELRARAGVLTGEAAVTIGAEGEGMVAGDLVNTASRVQSVAQPGAVRCRHRGHCGRDRCLRDRQLEFQQRRGRQRERGHVGAIEPGQASRRSDPEELASRHRNDHHGSGGEQGQGRGACQVPGGNCQPCAEAEQRLVRGPHDQDQLAAPRLRQQELQGHRRHWVSAPVC
jgi:adenylate/guanylate cyclase family protein